jgi:rubredoxin
MHVVGQFHVRRRSALDVKLDSVVTCSMCGYRSKERMPTDYCLIKYQCRKCGYVMTPKAGDCCIFCSYGSVPCPPIQEAASQ